MGTLGALQMESHFFISNLSYKVIRVLSSPCEIDHSSLSTKERLNFQAYFHQLYFILL